MTPPELIVMSDVGFCFGRGRHSIPVLENISFTLHTGESLAIMGASGVGKTTLCRVLSGLIFPTVGQVFFQGRRLTGPSSAITISFQDYPCFPWLSVEGNVLFGLRSRRTLDATNDREYAFWLLDQVGLAVVRRAYPRELSGGMLQRLSLARALAVRPDVLILDEPFSALDLGTKTELKNLILLLREKMHFSLVVVLHDLADAHSVADRALVLDGRPARITLDAELAHLSLQEFQAQVLDAMHGNGAAGPAIDFRDLLACIRDRRLPQGDAISHYLTGAGAAYAHKHIREADAPYVLDLLRHTHPNYRRLGLLLARPLLTEPRIREAHLALWQAEKDFEVQVHLIYNLLEYQDFSPVLQKAALQRIRSNWRAFSDIIDRWYDLPREQRSASILSKIRKTELPSAKCALYLLEFLTTVPSANGSTPPNLDAVADQLNGVDADVIGMVRSLAAEADSP